MVTQQVEVVRLKIHFPSHGRIRLLATTATSVVTVSDPLARTSPNSRLSQHEVALPPGTATDSARDHCLRSRGVALAQGHGHCRGREAGQRQEKGGGAGGVTLLTMVLFLAPTSMCLPLVGSTVFDSFS